MIDCGQKKKKKVKPLSGVLDLFEPESQICSWSVKLIGVKELSAYLVC